MKSRLVFDTNCLISAMLSPDSIVANCFRKALENGGILTSEDCFEELIEVLKRSKFKKYFTESQIEYVIAVLTQQLVFQKVESKVSACRDPKDNKFLSLAKDSNAKYLITGDLDLLQMLKYEETEIITPRSYLENTNEP